MLNNIPVAYNLISYIGNKDITQTKSVQIHVLLVCSNTEVYYLSPETLSYAYK